MKSDGNEVIIFGTVLVDATSVPKVHASIEKENWHAFESLVREVVGGDVTQLTLPLIKEILIRSAKEDMRLGDRYNTDLDYVNGLIPEEIRGLHYGLYRRNDKDPCRAVYVLGVGGFEGMLRGLIGLSETIRRLF